MTLDTLQARRAVESLRSGVPSASAVRALGSGQELLESRFRNLLGLVESERHTQVPGMLMRAGFGEGKSHLLTCFENIALDAGFAVSRVVISKETPLQTPGKVLASAAENMRIPKTLGQGLEELALLLRKQVNSEPYRQLMDTSTLDSRFGATLHLLDYASGELEDRIIRFWSGDKLIVSEIRTELRNLDAHTRFPLSSIKARDLALQTMSFLPLLCRVAGLKGWVVLIDEVELIGRYTRLARARAYAELARWLQGFDRPRPGLLTVGAITSDFSVDVLKGGKTQDLDQIEPFLRGRDPEAAAGAVVGMRLIEQAIELDHPAQAQLKRCYDHLRELHATAYRWSPPEVPWPEVLGSVPVRTYVRAWINGWDVQRLYPDESVSYEFNPVKHEYREDAEMEGPEAEDN